ncbi:hypothetical protein C8R43DRAFT_166074 [Mycena crocata]|nr:hypothetical protein C8R43DRAFT_166074 [Mycena crocata]
MSVLPPELEREIFELTLRSDLKNAALKLNLSLVARRVQFWVEPVFYELVMISGLENAEIFLRLIALKPPGFFATAVKALCLVHNVQADHAFNILSACTGVEVLACWVAQSGHPNLPLLISQLSLRRLSIEFDHFLSIPVALTWLSNLTRIDLVFWDVTTSESHLSSLCHRLRVLPRLTHLSIASVETAMIPYAQAVSSCCPELEALVIARSDSDINKDALIKACKFDPRVVVVDELVDPAADWETGYFGGVNIWSRAGDILRQLNTSQGDRS